MPRTPLQPFPREKARLGNRARGMPQHTYRAMPPHTACPLGH